MSEKETAVMTSNLEPFEEAIRKALKKVAEQDIVNRIWERDHTVWKSEDREISSRLGWLFSPEEEMENIPAVEKLVREAGQDGFTHGLLLGMGGSSLAPEVLSAVFQKAPGTLELHILDSTVPAAVLSVQNRLPLDKTLFLVSSKSGTTIETLSFFRHFFHLVGRRAGAEKTGRQFIAITDPGTPLESLASSYGFRTVIPGNPDIGGRFSALSPFGLVPAALAGVDLQKLLENGRKTAHLCRNPRPEENPGVFLGTVLAVLAEAAIDKATFFLSRRLESFGFWLEQLLAESTGKEGRGILPVAGEPAGPREVYGEDRLFIFIHEENDRNLDGLHTAFRRAKRPLLSLPVSNEYELGGLFFLWEMATAAAGCHLEINPFDQPDVSASKKKTGALLNHYREKGILPLEEPSCSADGITLFSEGTEAHPKEGLKAFLARARAGDYIAVLAFIEQTAETGKLMTELRTRLRDRTKSATSAGFGPRYLHSTGQLYKGDGGNGLFIQLTADDVEDVSIPDETGLSHPLSFGVLKEAQARGDREALKVKKRRFIRFHLGKDVTGGMEKLISWV